MQSVEKKFRQIMKITKQNKYDYYLPVKTILHPYRVPNHPEEEEVKLTAIRVPPTHTACQTGQFFFLPSSTQTVKEQYIPCILGIGSGQKFRQGAFISDMYKLSSLSLKKS